MVVDSKLRLYPVNELAPLTEVFDNLSRGAIQMVAHTIDVDAGKNPAYLGVAYWTGNPFGNDMSFELIHKYLTDHPKIVQEMVNRDNIYYLGGYSIPSEAFQSTVPINSIEDYEGLKVRTAGLSEKLHVKLGCAVTRISSAEIYTALQLGTIDAF